MGFEAYKFKPADVVAGLNKYYDLKKKRYINHFKVKTKTPSDCETIVFSDAKVSEAINWLREEHDIFYTPGMEVPVEDFDVDEAAKEYEKATRTSDIFCEENLDMVSVTRVREALGIAEDSDIFECIKYRNHQLETLRTELVETRRMYHNSVNERNKFGRRLADIRHAAGMNDLDPTDLVEYIEDLAKSRRETLDDWFGEHAIVLGLKDEIIKVYREIFDCSNGDPEGSDAETLQDILTEYKRTLELKNVAEEKAIKYKELARENEEKAARYKVRLDNTERQLRWTEEVSRERLEKYEKLTNDLREALGIVDEYVDIIGLARKLKEERDALKEKYDRLYISYEKTYRAKFTKLSEERDHYKWLYESLKIEHDEMTKRYGESVITSGGICEDLAKEREKVQKMAQKLIEIQDICER